MADCCDDRPSEIQADWQELARRLRMQLDRCLSCIEKQLAKGSDDDDAITCEALQHLATAALSAFALERQAASMDAAMRRDGTGW